MEIASCILILTLVVYLDFADCSTSGNQGLPVNAALGRRAPRTDPVWVETRSGTLPVWMAFDTTDNNKAVDIKLVEGQDNVLLNMSSHLMLATDHHHKISYYIQTDGRGNTLAVYPVTNLQAKAIYEEHERQEASKLLRERRAQQKALRESSRGRRF